jgi:hypothetical protein
VSTSKCDSDSQRLNLGGNIVAIMFAEVANYANDAGMFVFLLSCCFALPVRVPRGSDLPSEALCVYEE